jgi:carbohydrate-selective porin OprB
MFWPCLRTRRHRRGWKAQDVINGIDSADEGHIELFYNLAVNEHVTVTPDFQWVASAGGDGDADDFFVFGLRTQFTF